MDFSKINLNYIPFLIAVAESRTLEEAGDKIGYDYSTVSSTLAKLEKQYGVKICTRKPLRLTKVGNEMYKAVKTGMSYINFAKVVADSKNDISIGSISIGCPSHITEFYLLNKIARAVNDYPNLKIDLETAYECEDLIESLKCNKSNFAILDRIPAECEKDIEIKEIKRSKYIFISNKKITVKKAEELEKYKYILASEQRSNTIKLTNILKEHNVKIDTVLVCRNNRTKSKCSKRRNTE